MVPSNPIEAKGLLLASIRDPNPVIFLEPKWLYRSAVEEVPLGDYEIPLGKARVIREGTDITVVGYGAQLHVLADACEKASQEQGVSCELIDLRTLAPWDKDTVIESVKKTGRLIVSHEAPKITYLRFSPDSVLEGMLVQLGLQIVSEIAPFYPQGGAYSHQH